MNLLGGGGGISGVSMMPKPIGIFHVRKGLATHLRSLQIKLLRLLVLIIGDHICLQF